MVRVRVLGIRHLVSFIFLLFEDATKNLKFLYFFLLKTLNNDRSVNA
jgi:hypothetical protein